MLGHLLVIDHRYMVCPLTMKSHVFSIKLCSKYNIFNSHETILMKDYSEIPF